MRAVLLLVAIGLATSCHSYAPTRTPECNAIVNRCMDSCSYSSDVLSPREQAISNGRSINSVPSSCESRCASKC